MEISNSNRPQFERKGIELFESYVITLEQFTFTGNLETPLAISEIKEAQTWMNIFVGECSQILKGFSDLIAQENLGDFFGNIP